MSSNLIQDFESLLINSSEDFAFSLCTQTIAGPDSFVVFLMYSK
jgi:hypothetical protein